MLDDVPYIYIYIYVCMYAYEQINKCETQINYKKKNEKWELICGGTCVLYNIRAIQIMQNGKWMNS